MFTLATDFVVDDPLEDADADADEKKIDAIDEDDLPLTESCKMPCAEDSPSKGQKRKTQKPQRRQRRKTVWVAFRSHSEPLSHVVI